MPGEAREQSATVRVFLSYRRQDSAAYTGRLFDSLSAELGPRNVFMDIDTIAPGSDFTEVIVASLQDCDAALVVIGPTWASLADASGRQRLADPNDFVRLEVEIALQRDMRVIPVLVGGASVPAAETLPPSIQGLARRHAVELSDKRWHYDVGQLLSFLRDQEAARPLTGAQFANLQAQLAAGRAQAPAPTGLVTLLYAEAHAAQGAVSAAALDRCDQIVRDGVANAGGFVSRSLPGAITAAFASPGTAAAAAVAVQRALVSASWPDQRPVPVAMALNSGPSQRSGEGYVGAVADRAARLVAVAHGGQVICSVLTAELVRDELPEGVSLLDLGTHRLRDLGRAEGVFQLALEGLERNFPPLRSLDHSGVLHNLPEQPSTFVGREREIAEVAALLRTSRLITLSGPGGVGKTRLALQAVADVVDDSGDGAWFVDLAPIDDTSLVVPSVASALWVREEPGRPLLDSMVDALGDRQLIVLHDNCEQVVETVARMDDTVLRRCPHVVFLATSREPLRIHGEHIYRVPSLPLPGPDVDDPAVLLGYESVQLFVERAAQQSPGFTVATPAQARSLARLCRRLDGIPFAIELAAARMRSMSIEDLESRLDKRFRVLTGGSRSELPRRQTLQALIDFSFDLLPVPQQTLFRRLSVFSGGFDLEAAETVCPGGDVEDFEVLDLLDELVNKSMIQADNSGARVRYKLLETMRDYARVKLAQAPEDEAETLAAAHRDYYLAVAADAAPHVRGPHELQWLGRLDEELDNLRAALSQCLLDPDPEPGLKQAEAMSDYFDVRGRAAEGVDVLNAQLDRPEAAAPTALRGRALAATARLLEYHVGDYGRAEALAGDALTIGQSHGDEWLVAKARMVLAWARYRQGDAAACQAILEEALPAARKLSDPRLAAHLLNLEGYVRSATGGDAEASFEEAAALYRRAGDRYGMAVVLANIGGMALVVGDLGRARDSLEQAAQIFRELDHRYNLAGVAAVDGIVAHLSDDDAVAESRFRESLAIARRIGGRRILAYALLGLALTATRREDHKRAAILHGAFDAREVTLDDLEGALRDADQERLRAALGERAFTEALESGRALPIEDAFAFAAESSSGLSGAGGPAGSPTGP